MDEKELRVGEKAGKQLKNKSRKKKKRDHQEFLIKSHREGSTEKE